MHSAMTVKCSALGLANFDEMQFRRGVAVSILENVCFKSRNSPFRGHQSATKLSGVFLSLLAVISRFMSARFDIIFTPFTG